MKIVFLHGKLNVLVFMEQPPRFTDPLRPDHVCSLKKALYGLHQAPRAWFERFSSFLFSVGFSCSSADSSLFIYQSHGHIMLLLLYVDDIIVTGNHSSLLHQFIAA